MQTNLCLDQNLKSEGINAQQTCELLQCTQKVFQPLPRLNCAYGRHWQMLQEWDPNSKCQLLIIVLQISEPFYMPSFPTPLHTFSCYFIPSLLVSESPFP